MSKIIAQNSDHFQAFVFDNIDEYKSWCEEQVRENDNADFLISNSVYEVENGESTWDGNEIEIHDFHCSLYNIKRQIMIAVFTYYPNDFKRGRISGADDIRIIRDIDSVRGMDFTSVMELDCWYDSRKLREAHEALSRRQPELFKEFRKI